MYTCVWVHMRSEKATGTSLIWHVPGAAWLSCFPSLSPSSPLFAISPYTFAAHSFCTHHLLDCPCVWVPLLWCVCYYCRRRTLPPTLFPEQQQQQQRTSSSTSEATTTTSSSTSSSAFVVCIPKYVKFIYGSRILFVVAASAASAAAAALFLFRGDGREVLLLLLIASSFSWSLSLPLPLPPLVPTFLVSAQRRCCRVDCGLRASLKLLLSSLLPNRVLLWTGCSVCWTQLRYIEWVVMCTTNRYW